MDTNTSPALMKGPFDTAKYLRINEHVAEDPPHGRPSRNGATSIIPRSAPNIHSLFLVAIMRLTCETH